MSKASGQGERREEGGCLCFIINELTLFCCCYETTLMTTNYPKVDDEEEG